MIAYKKEWLDNLSRLELLANAHAGGLITKEEHQSISTKYPVGFYTPNIFIRIGLFLLTLLIMLFAFGLLSLVFISAIEKMFSGLLIFFALVSYASLEAMISRKKHFRSGVDDGLLWGASICLFCGVGILNDFTPLMNSLLVCCISFFGAVRYSDRLMATICYLSVLAIVFYTFTGLGGGGRIAVPFVIMGVSLIVYLFMKQLKDRETTRHYAACISWVEATSLISLYTAGNYFVVRELSIAMFHWQLLPSQGIPFGGIFWCTSVIIPVAYLVIGIWRKDRIMLRVGLLIFAAMLITLRNYYAFMAVETFMTVVGLALLMIAYALNRFLHEPKHGFTSAAVGTEADASNLQLESLVIAQGFSAGADSGGTKFGGGSFGGGGASGDY